jgi:quinol monooxygenase YgiN
VTIVVLGTMRFPAANLEAVKPHLHELLEATRTLDGCITYDAAFDPYDPGLVRFSELWPDMATLKAHLVAPHIAPWRDIASHYGVRDRSFTAWEGANPQSV